MRLVLSIYLYNLRFVHVYIGTQTIATLFVTIRQSGPSRQLTDSIEVVAILAVVSLPEKVEHRGLHLHTVQLVVRI